MFIRIQRIEEASFAADQLQNPVNPNNVMVLGFYRNYVATAINSGYSKKAAPIYWDTITGKTISRRKWSPEMKSYADECLKQVRPAPYKFKLTIFGYILLLAVIGLFGYLIYDTVKPNPYAVESSSKLMEPMQGGDLYFGRYTEIDSATKIGKGAGFGWFKIVDAGEGSLLISKSVEMSSSHKPSDKMNSDNFEPDPISMKMILQESYPINLVSEDGTLEVSLTEKK